MPRARLLALLCLLFGLGAPIAARAQGADWTPPSREMPMMPRVSELSGDWLTPRAAWFRGVDGITGVASASLRGSGEARASNPVAQIARFSNGPVPVVVWSDRNGDGRCDMIEIFRGGGVAVQVIDADYDGIANVVRIYDTDGKLLRQNQL